MHRLGLILAFALGTSAQEVTLTSSETTTATKMTVREFTTLNRANETPIVVVSISVQTSGGVETRYFNVAVPSAACGSATVAGVFTALDTVRASETGGVLRRANFRILGYLKDNDCGLPAGTLVP